MKSIIIDVDSSLCNVDDILYHIIPELPGFSGKKDFDAFHKAAEQSPPNEIIKTIVNGLVDTHYAFIVTSRKERWRNSLERWLEDNYIFYDEIYMRADDDRRKAVEVKRDILKQIVDKGYIVELAIDDDLGTIEMFNGYKIPTLLMHRLV